MRCSKRFQFIREKGKERPREIERIPGNRPAVAE